MSTSAGRVLLIPKGEYNGATTYNVLDWVLYQGKPYVAKQTTTGNVPTNTTYWQLLVDNPTTDMVGATSSVAGAHGLVPAPSAGDNEKVLRGDGTWGDLPNAIIQQIPIQAVPLVYNGSAQSPSWLFYNPNIVTIGGQTSGTNVGTYVATFTPNQGYCWDDLSTSAKSIAWTIGQAEGSATFPQDPISVTAANPEDRFTIAHETGAISVSCSDTTVATVALGGASNHTVITTGLKTGSATLTINIAASQDGNYSAKTYTLPITANMKPNLVSWVSGSAAEIERMVNGYYNGDLTLDEIKSVWSVGDERYVTLSAMEATGVGEAHVAQSVTLVIMNFGGKKLSSDGTTDVLAVIGQKNLLSNGTSVEYGYMIESQSGGGWDACPRRTWCNNVYKNAIPSDLRPIFKQFNNHTGSVGGSSSSKVSADYFALPSEKELFGNNPYSDATAEAAEVQFDYYKTSSNQIKKAGNSGSATVYWNRSQGRTRDFYFCLVFGDGSKNETAGYQTAGIAPFGCI